MRLKELRIENGYNQKQLADVLGYKQNTVSQWESEKRLMDAEVLCKVADCFGVTVDYLIGRSAHKNGEKIVNPLALELANEYSKLNDFGKREAVKRVSELTHISAYTNINYPVAAHIEAKVTKKELELMQQDIDEL